MAVWFFCIIFAYRYQYTLIYNMARHNDIGRRGEDIACELLVREGYAIVARNWRMNRYEVDIVALKGDRMVFAEVKTRSDGCDPLDAVDERKMSYMACAADAYVQAYGVRHSVQFDVFGIWIDGDDFKVEHIADAFLPPLKQYSK